MRRLTKVYDQRATKLFNELQQEIRDFENKNNIELLKPISTIDSMVGSYKSTKALGNCLAHRIGGTIMSFKISLNQELVENGSDKDIKDVLTHEYIHTAYGCFNHGSNFKHKANTIKYYLGYDGLKNRFDKKYVADKGQRTITYRCINCGKLFKRYRHIDTTRYSCPCHGRLELVPNC